MKHLFTLILSGLLLCGCAAPSLPENRATAQTSAPQCIADADSVSAWSLPVSEGDNIRMMGEKLLIFSGCETTTLTLVSPEDFTVTAQRELGFRMASSEPSLQLWQQAVSFYDPVNRETVVLDDELNVVCSIAAPQELLGTPLLSRDRSTLYYASPTALRAWDLKSGIRRTLTEMNCTGLTLTGLYINDTILHCKILDGSREEHLFLSAENGMLLDSVDGALQLSGQGSRCYAVLSSGRTQTFLFGEKGTSPQVLIPAQSNSSIVFLDPLHAAVSINAGKEGGIRFDYYDLRAGLRRSSLTLAADRCPTAITGAPDGSVYILMQDQVLYRWDVDAAALEDDHVYTGIFYSAEHPDTEGIARCRSYADRIGSKYGIQILLWDEAVAVQPWDYEFQPEHHVPVLERQLALLEHQLSLYPVSVLSDTASHFSSLQICLVRSIRGTPESGSLDAANGLQFFSGNDAYVVLSMEESSEQVLFHELFHVMETCIWAKSIALDQWDSLNPKGFSYDYDYTANASRDSGIYLENTSRAFVDTYSMSFPKEDRARIIEHAMLPGQEDLFRSPIMQRKLLTLCQGIREAYGLEDAPEDFLWEQYLEDPIS